jgi:hemin uptake protein HemP
MRQIMGGPLSETGGDSQKAQHVVCSLGSKKQLQMRLILIYNPFMNPASAPLDALRPSALATFSQALLQPLPPPIQPTQKPLAGRESVEARGAQHPQPHPDHWRSEELLQGRTRVHIEHQGQTYCLHHTRQGKLILTK